MRILGTRLHGIIDYLAAALLILAPFLFGFADGTAAMWAPIIIGLATIGYSLVTDYELGLRPLIGMRTHIVVDMAAGIALIASPWVFLFAQRIFWPHLAIGAAYIVIPFITDTVPRHGRA